MVIAGIDGLAPWQARLTFAMARHTVVDLAQIVNAPPRAPEPDRLPRGGLGAIQSGAGGGRDRALRTPRSSTPSWRRRGDFTSLMYLRWRSGLS